MVTEKRMNANQLPFFYCQLQVAFKTFKENNEKSLSSHMIKN